MDEETQDEELLKRFMDQIGQHAETRWEYFTLTATEKASAIAANVAGALTLLLFALIVLFFFTFGLAWWFGDLISSRAGGFALTGLIYIPIAFGLSRWVRPWVRTMIIDSILEEELKSDSKHE
jgi:Putative Actinobacterial Holin-X, holin superfamily III